MDAKAMASAMDDDFSPLKKQNKRESFKFYRNLSLKENINTELNSNNSSFIRGNNIVKLYK